MKKIQLIIIVLLLLFFGCSNSDTVNSVSQKSKPVDLENIKMPSVESADKLGYPFFAKLAGIEGYIIIKIHIDSEGKVIGHEIEKRKFSSTSIPFSNLGIMLFQSKFDSLAIKYVQSMIFKPAIKDNHPIDIWVKQPIRWELDKD